MPLLLLPLLLLPVGDVARKYIKNEELLRFIDIECFVWSTVVADLTPMINAGMVFCDRHHGGVNYPLGGVGRLGEMLVDGEGEGGEAGFGVPVRRGLGYLCIWVLGPCALRSPIPCPIPAPLRPLPRASGSPPPPVCPDSLMSPPPSPAPAPRH